MVVMGPLPLHSVSRNNTELPLYRSLHSMSTFQVSDLPYHQEATKGPRWP